MIPDEAAGTGRAIVGRLSAELKKAVEHSEVAKTLSAQTLDPMYMTPEQFALRLKSNYDKVRESGQDFRRQTRMKAATGTD